MLLTTLLLSLAAPVDTVHHLDEVTVLSHHVLPEQTLKGVELQSLLTVSVADALKYFAGVQLKDYGGLGGQKTVNVRSLGSQHVGVYLDGVRITNAQNGTVDLGKYSLSMMESVSLFNANKSERLMMPSEYASASTIYLQTRKPEKTELSIKQQIGSFNMYKTELNAAYKEKALLSVEFAKSKGNYQFRYKTEFEDTVGTRRNADIQFLRAEAVTYLGAFTSHAYFYTSERGLPGGIVRRLSSKYTDVGREWDTNVFLQTSWKRTNENYGLSAKVKYAYDKLHYNSDYPENIAAHSNNTYIQQDIYSAFGGYFTLGDFTLSPSLDLRLSDLSCDVKRFSYVYRVDMKQALSAIYSNNNFTLNASILNTYVRDHTNLPANPLNKLTYSIIASKSMNKLSIRLFYKQVFRAPTLNDLYYTLVGNRSLKPEFTKQFDTGISFRNNYLDIQADCYYNLVTDRIVCLPLKGSFQWTMLNYGKTRSYGLNVSVTGRYKHSSLFTTLTLQDDRNITSRKESGYKDFIPYSPKVSATAVYTFSTKNFDCSVSHMFVSERYWTAENMIEPPLTAYNCTDAKITYKSRFLMATIECQDIFDVRYEIIQRWPMPGRRYALTVKFTL